MKKCVDYGSDSYWTGGKTSPHHHCTALFPFCPTLKILLKHILTLIISHSLHHRGKENQLHSIAIDALHSPPPSLIPREKNLYVGSKVFVE